MIAKKYKLPIPEFLSKKPKITAKSACFSVRKLTNNLEFSRFGVIISKKTTPKAVNRNKIKRTIFNLIKTDKLNKKHGFDFLITVFLGVAELNKKEFEKKLGEVLE